MRACSILMIPVLLGLLLLRAPYDGTLSTLLIFDGIGLLLIVLIMFIHEYLHAITFSKDEDVSIYMYKFSMLTHCTQDMNIKEMIRTFLFPNLCITLPVTIIMLILNLIGVSGLIAKVTGFIGLIIVIGAYDDLCKFSFLQRNQKQIHHVRLSGMNLYYKWFKTNSCVRALLKKKKESL